MLKINGYTNHDGSGRADVVGLFSFFGKIYCGTWKREKEDSNRATIDRRDGRAKGKFSDQDNYEQLSRE